jgi:hypothetical protein
MDLDQDEVFGASSRDGDLSGASFRFRHAEEHAAANPRIGSIHKGSDFHVSFDFSHDFSHQELCGL